MFFHPIEKSGYTFVLKERGEGTLASPLKETLHRYKKPRSNALWLF
jgi:hypothetical protein